MKRHTEPPPLDGPCDDGPLFSVVIPTRNAWERLARTLDSIARVEFELDRIEVIVADDGSTDETASMLRSRTDPFRLRIVRGDWASQSAATNAGIAVAQGVFVFLTAQDILFHPALLRQHLAWHERFMGQEIAVLGDLPYPDQLEVTPFMFYLVNGGFQFAYHLIKDALHVPPNFLYAPNVSLRRETLQRVGSFDEQFPFGCQDTDLGIRLVEHGVRLIYNRLAIGYHNHPIDLGGFLRRQELAGQALVRLARKHPDYEGGAAVWDVVIRSGLAYSRLQYDRDHADIDKLERALLTAHPDYQELWIRAFCRQEPMSGFTERQQRTLATFDALFGAYNRVLLHHWALGFQREALGLEGPERVGAIIRARLSKQQLSSCTRRLIARRMSEAGLAPGCPAGGRHFSAKVIHGIDDYASAGRCLEPYQLPQQGGFNQHTVLVLERDRFTADEIERIEEAVEVIVCDDPALGIHEALRRVRADIVIVAAARHDASDARTLNLADKLFSRFDGLGILGGGVREAGGRVRYGWRSRSGGKAEPLVRPAGEADTPTPVDAANGEYLVLRRAIVEPLLDRPWSGPTWHLELCRRIAELGVTTLYVPDFSGTATETPVMVGVTESS